MARLNPQSIAEATAALERYELASAGRLLTHLSARAAKDAPTDALAEVFQQRCEAAKKAIDDVLAIGG